MKIPVFVSRPNQLTPDQDVVLGEIFAILADLSLIPRTLDQTDSPNGSTLKDVRTMVRRCFGGLVLGFAQEQATNIERFKHETVPHKTYPSPWNQVEAGLLYASQLPTLVWREPAITGGVFDEGASESSVYTFSPGFSRYDSVAQEVFSNWKTSVRDYYDKA